MTWIPGLPKEDGFYWAKWKRDRHYAETGWERTMIEVNGGYHNLMGSEVGLDVDKKGIVYSLGNLPEFQHWDQPIPELEEP